MVKVSIAFLYRLLLVLIFFFWSSSDLCSHDTVIFVTNLTEL